MSINDSTSLPDFLLDFTGCCSRLRRSSSAIGVGRYWGTVSTAFVDGVCCCVDFSTVSLLIMADCAVECKALASAVDKLCRSVFCNIDVKSTDGVGFVVVVAVEVAAAAVDNWLMSLLRVSLASRIIFQSFYSLYNL